MTSRPLSEITAEAQAKLSPVERGLGWQKRDQINEVRRLLAELSGRLDGTVTLTRDEAWEIAAGAGVGGERGAKAEEFLRSLLCGRPDKEQDDA